MRIINKQSGKQYTDLAELLRDENARGRRSELQGEYHSLSLTYREGMPWQIYFLQSPLLSSGNTFPLPPDRYTVCPDDCVTIAEARDMVEIKSLAAGGYTEIFTAIAFHTDKYLGEQA